jgi:branched-chain amino acid transport system substrate-binding protein
MTRQTISAITLITLAPLLIAACGSNKPAITPIKMGALYNLEGSQAALDLPSASGARLAVKEINRNGGINGRPVELVLYNGKTDPDTIKQAARRLIEQDQVAAIAGFSDSDMVLAGAPIAATAKTVFITSGATAPTLPGQVKDYLFLACFGDNVQAAAGAHYAYINLGIKTSALLVDTKMEYTMLLARYFKESFAEMGGKIILEDTYQGGAIDFSAQVGRLKALDPPPNMVYVASGPDDIGPIVKQLRQAGLSMPIMGGDAYDTPLLSDIAGKYADGVYFTTHALLDEKSGTERTEKFISAYKAEYNRLPENAFAALGYDTVKILADALSRARPDSPESVVPALLEIRNFPAVTGDISYENNSRIPRKSVTVVIIDNGRPTLAATVTPQKAPAP